jgi:hypothetical protein
MAFIKDLWIMIARSPSRGVALAKILVPLIGVIVLIIVALMGYGDLLPEKFQWINTMGTSKNPTWPTAR